MSALATPDVGERVRVDPDRAPRTFGPSYAGRLGTVERRSVSGYVYVRLDRAPRERKVRVELFPIADLQRLADTRPSTRGAFEFIAQGSWQIHHGGCQRQAPGIWGQVTKVRVGDETAYVREAVRGDRFMITGPMRIRMKMGEVPDPLYWVLEVLGSASVRALIEEEERATCALSGKAPRMVAEPGRGFSASWAEERLRVAARGGA